MKVVLPQGKGARKRVQLLILVPHGLGVLTADLIVKLPYPQHFRTLWGKSLHPLSTNPTWKSLAEPLGVPVTLAYEHES